MYFTNNGKNFEISENLILSIGKNSNEKTFLLKKILKRNNEMNKNNYNISNNIHFSKNKVSSNKMNIFSKLEKKHKAFSFVNRNKFENEILSKLIAKKNNKIINFKELNKIDYDCFDEIPKILAFKENFLVHGKNISLCDNRNTSERINLNNNNIINSKDNNQLIIKAQRSKIIQKFKRPNSVVFGLINKKKHPIFNNLEINDISFNLQMNNNSDKKKKINKKYNNLSYTNIRNRNDGDLKNNGNKGLVSDIEDSFFHCPSKSPSKKQKSFNEINNLIEHNYTNIDKDFKKRPMSSINKKYFIYLPKDMKKDFKNKYNFFSYLITENINYNYKKINNLSKFKKFKTKKYNNFKNNNKNKKQNFTQNNINLNENIFTNFKLNCKKEQEFMSYLKDLDYIQKHPKNMKDNINSNYNEKIPKIKINNKNNIYMPVKIKVGNLNSNENKVDDEKIIISNEEENELCEKIKSQPFNIKKKKKL